MVNVYLRQRLEAEASTKMGETDCFIYLFVVAHGIVNP